MLDINSRSSLKSYCNGDGFVLASLLNGGPGFMLAMIKQPGQSGHICD